MKLVDYIAAGQDRGAWVVWATLVATALGASSTLGVAAKAEEVGMASAWWLAAGAAGLALQGAVLSGRIRETGAKTLPELARKTVGPAAQRAVAAVIAIAWPGVVGAQFAALGGVVDALAGTAWGWRSVVACAAPIILYTLAGGQRAVVKTDVWQLLLLAAGFGGLFWWVFSGRCGGEGVGAWSMGWLGEGLGMKEAALTMLTVGGAYLLGPDVASRALVARDGRTARRAALGAAPVLLAFGVAMAMAGMWAAKNAPGPGNPVFRIAAGLPWGLRWGLAAGVVAALASSADTCLMNAGAIVANDLLGAKGVGTARWVVAGVGAAGVALALGGGDVISILLKAYSVYTPGVAMPLAVAVWAGRAEARWWFAAVAAGGACGLAGWPVAGMGVSLGMALVAAAKGRGATG